MIEVEYKKGNICAEYKGFQAVAFSLVNYEEARTETEKCFYGSFSKELEASVQKKTDVKGKPFLGNVVSSKVKKGKTLVLIQMYTPKYNEAQSGSEQALLRSCFLKAAFEAEKWELSNLAISIDDLSFPESVLQEVVTDITEIIKGSTHKWKFLKKVTFLGK